MPSVLQSATSLSPKPQQLLLIGQNTHQSNEHPDGRLIQIYISRTDVLWVMMTMMMRWWCDDGNNDDDGVLVGDQIMYWWLKDWFVCIDINDNFIFSVLVLTNAVVAATFLLPKGSIMCVVSTPPLGVAPQNRFKGVEVDILPSEMGPLFRPSYVISSH